MRECRRRHETVGNLTKGESEMKRSLRLKLLSQGAILLFSASSATMALAAGTDKVDVYKSPSCGCCGLWVEHMKKSGFAVEIHEVRNVAPFRERFGVPDSMASCHTAVVGGYAIEGHVPAADIKRLLREKPKAAGIAVPGMAVGSPGMEQGSGKDPYNVVLFNASGRTTVFSAH
jgi:hypothetical protein